MKTILLFTLPFLVSSAYAAPSVEKLVVMSVDATLGDTVNEGDRSVEAQKATCTFVKKQSEANVTIAKCDVEISVKIDECEEEPSVTSCFLIHEFKGKKPKFVKRVAEGLMNSCVESLNSVECGD